jgi:hypothetical protein
LETETTCKSCLGYCGSTTVGVLGVEKENQVFSVETCQNETKVLNRLSKSGEKAFQVFKIQRQKMANVFVF